MFGWFTKKKRAKILLVDDEDVVILPLKERLETSGYEVFIASNGQQGLIRALKYMPDLILLDTNMPHMNGRQMLERMRENPQTCGIMVVMLTGNKTIDDVEQADKLGIEDYIIKPFDTHELMIKIEQILVKGGVLEPAC